MGSQVTTPDVVPAPGPRPTYRQVSDHELVDLITGEPPSRGNATRAEAGTLQFSEGHAVPPASRDLTRATRGGLSGPTYRQLMDAAKRADALGEAADARRLLELALDAERAAANQAPRAGSGERYRPAPASTVALRPSGQSSTPPSAPEEPGLIDAIMDYAAPVGSAASYAGQELARGVTQMLGAPVDLVNASPMLGNLLPGEQGFEPFSDKPVLGSEFLWDLVTAPRDALQDVAGLPVGDRQPQNAAERIVGRAAQEVGAAAVPVAGALGAASRVGAQGARQMSGPVGRFVESAAVAPGRFAATEGAYASAAGTGAGMARELVSDGDPATTTGREFIADTVGALAGAGTFAAGRAAARAATDAGQALSGRGGATVVRDAVAGELGNAAGAPSTASGAADTSGLADALRRNGNRVAETVPGYRESSADSLENSGLAALEYSRQSGPNAGRYVAQRNTNAAAVADAMDTMAPDAAPGAFSEAARGRRDEILGAAEHQSLEARTAFDSAAQRLRSTMTGEARGQAVRAALDEALGAARAVEREAWSGVAGQANARPLARAFQEIDGRLTAAQRETIRDAGNLTRIPAALAGAPDDEHAALLAAVFGDGDVSAASGVVDLSEITTLRSSISDQVRAARTAGQPDRARILDRYVGAIDEYLGHSTPEETAEALANARRVSFDLNERFTRPGDPVAETVRRAEGRPRVPDSQVAGRFVQPDSGQASNLDRLLSEANDAGDVREALRDQILGDVQARGLLDNPDRLDQYLGQYGRAFARFPELRSELGNAAALRRQVTAAEDAWTSLRRTLGADNGSTVGRYLAFGDERARDAMAAVANARQPGRAVDELLSFVGDDPQAVEGARAAFWELMEGTARGRGATTRTASGDQPWRPQALHRFVTSARNRAVMERLYRDQPDQLERIDAIAEALRNVDTRVTARAPNSSGTPQAITGNSVLPSTETLGAYGFAYRRGQVGLPFIGLRLVSTMARRAILRGRGQQFQELLDEALLNPEVAEMLLRDHNPANVDAMSRWAKGWAGARAPVFMDMLEGGNQERR